MRGLNLRVLLRFFLILIAPWSFLMVSKSFKAIFRLVFIILAFQPFALGNILVVLRDVIILL